MFYTPMPTQIAGANFLAARRRALLADAPRVGKTGAAIMAADIVQASKILVITTASGKSVWRRAWPRWSRRGQTVALHGDKNWERADVTIAGWPTIHKISPAEGRQFDLIILDEAHAAKNPETRRAKAVYGPLQYDGRLLLASLGLIDPEACVWLLTGTPAPHDLGDLYIHLRASMPGRLLADPERGWPDVLTRSDFMARYCITREKQLSSGAWITVVIGGRNEAELRERIGDFMLRRTQADVGIREPVRELMPIAVPPSARRQLIDPVTCAKIIEAIENGEQLEDEEMARVRRLTGVIKAEGVAQAARDVLDDGQSKLVIAYWHRDVGDILARELHKYGVERIDGAVTGANRERAEERFNGKSRVMLAQIIAAGEAIDLSAAAELWFCETSFSPKDMTQMSSRISNVNQQANTFVKICYIEDSIDEAIQETVARLAFSIDEVIA